MKQGKKICVLGTGNVGATIAYTIALSGMAAEIVLIDIAKDKAIGEAMDISQGNSHITPVNIYSGDYPDAKGSDIVITTVGIARKPGMTRIDLAQTNVNIAKDVIPQITKVCPDAVYVIVSNPVDVITYTFSKRSGLDKSQIIGSGTTIDTSRLQDNLAAKLAIDPRSINAYVLGEHGDTSFIPWSVSNIMGIPLLDYCKEVSVDIDTDKVLDEVRKAGAQVISKKGATYYAIAMSVAKICDAIIKDTKTVLPVSNYLDGQYGISDVCVSLPHVVGANGVSKTLLPALTDGEVAQLKASADALKSVISSLDI
ncbi:MAG TPA: L-lactate dehydrogenase [Firmicutes bacterium]|mgnify:FL=1|nr:L-lactate dehydrogenase [Bacillota bacterium]